MAASYTSRRFFKILAAMALLPLNLCAKSPRNPDTVVYAHMGEMTTLDPVYPYDGVSQGMMINVYETLIMYKKDSLVEFVPALAEKVPGVENGLISKDGLTYKFPIRKGVKFHDGAELRPEDVRYSLLRFMLSDPAGGPASLMLEPILGTPSTRNNKGEIIVNFEQAARAVSVAGDDVVIKLKRPFAPFLSIMARWSYVLNKAWCVKNGEWDGEAKTWKEFNNRDKARSGLFEKMNGTGPFALERWDRKAKRLYLARFDGYWAGAAKTKRVIMMTAPEFGTRRLMLEAGDADIIDVPRPFEPQLRAMDGVALEDSLPRLNVDPVFFFTLAINPSGNPDIGSGRLDGNGIPPNFFSDPDVRQGFAYAFDNAAFLKESLKGKAARACGPVPPGLLGYRPGLGCHDYSLEKAKQHFKKAWRGKAWAEGFKFAMTYNTGGEVRQLACEILKKNVESLNPKFKIELRGLDWPAYLDKAQSRKMPLFTRGWTGDYPDPHNFVFPFYHTSGRYPAAQGYSNPALDALIAEAVKTVSAAKRQALYEKIQALGAAETLQIFTAFPQGLYARRSWLKGFYDNPVFMGIYFYPLAKQAE